MLTLITLITNKHICLHILLILFYGFLSFGAKRGLTVLRDTPWDCYDYLSTCDAKTLLGVRWRPVWMPQEYLLQVIKSKSASTFLRCLGIFHVANQIHIKGLVGFETEPPSEGGPFDVWWQAVSVKGSFVSGGRRRRRHVEPTWQGGSLSLPVQNLSSSSRGEREPQYSSCHQPGVRGTERYSTFRPEDLMMMLVNCSLSTLSTFHRAAPPPRAESG